ncbi:MAG: 50S ribosomal protein L11 methyltransferase [Nitriliruptorales bacterium]|nr:50S ribosomal protein L11 methyltransferase [Nitriliruptorales bacterium]
MRGRHRYTLPLDGARDPDLESARLFAAGAVGVWVQDDRVTGWFDAPTVEVPPGGSWIVEDDRDWQAEWKATIEPVRAGRVVVVPSWLADAHQPEPDDVIIVLDPGRAFGSGHHATTCLCLELLQGLGADGWRVLDVGTGTGVLAIAAVRLGAAEVWAADTDEDAITAATENLARNEVGDEVVLVHGSVADASGHFDVVLANLTSDTLRALAAELAAATTPGGALIASGIADERAGSTLLALTEQGFEVVRTCSRDGWTAVLTRRGGDS